MRRLGLSVILLFPFLAFAQFPVSPNQVDEIGRRTGHWTMLFTKNWQLTLNKDSAQYYRLIRFDAGKPVGKVRDFYRNGQKQWDGYLIAAIPDIMDGECNHYFENGNIKTKSYYRNGKEDGQYYEYNVYGVLLTEGQMKNDSSVGIWAYYRDDGSKRLQSGFRGRYNHGPYSEFHANGNLKRKGQHNIGKEEGYWESYYEDGTVNTKCYYKDGKRHGKWEWYNAQGILEEKGQYINGKNDGVWYNYYDDGKTLFSKGVIDSLGTQGYWEFRYFDGVKKAEGSFNNDRAEGVWTFYHPNGKISGKGVRRNSLYEGEWHFFYDDGSLHKKSNYLGDSLHGYQADYYRTGKIKNEGNRINGAKDGLWKFYFESGQLDATEELKMGILFGKVMNFHSNGSLKDSSYYENGARQGLFVSFHANGQKETEGMFVKGLREGEWKWYYDNGQLWSRYHYVNGKYEGAYENFHPNGVKKEFGLAKNGVEQGPQKHWFQNGNLWKAGRQENNKAEGLWIFYDSASGNRSSEGLYVANKLHGKWKFYDARGKQESVSYYINGFHEEEYSLRDSVYRLIDEKQYEQAWKAVGWIEKVIRRDKHQNTKSAAIPPMLYSRIELFRNDYDKALKWGLQFAELTKKIEGDTSHNYAVALNELANIYVKMKRHTEAIDIYRNVAAYNLKRNEMGNYHVALSNLAGTYASMNDTGEGERLLLAEVQRQVAKQGPHHLDVFAIKAILGSYYREESKDYAKCVEVMSALREDILASNLDNKHSRQVLNESVRLIADAYQSQRMRQEAIPWYKRCIELDEKQGLPNFVKYMDAHARLGYDYFKTGKLDSAVMLYDKMLSFLSKRNLQNTMSYVEGLHGKAEVLLYAYRREEALPLWEEARGILERIHQTQDLVYANILTGLSHIHREAGRFDEAEKYYRLACDVKLQAYGEADAQYLGILAGLGDLYRSMSMYDQAQKTLRNAEQLIIKYSGEQSYQYAECMTFIARTHYDLYQYKEALDANAKAIAYYRNDPANYADDYAEALTYQSRFYRFLGDFKNAEKLLIEALDVVEKYIGRETTFYLSYYSSLAFLYNKQGLYSDAVKINLEVLDGYSKLVGETNMQYGYALRDVARCYLDQDEYLKAEPYYIRYRDLSAKIVGEKSDEYRDAMYRLAVINDNLDRTTAAEKLYKQCLSISKAYGAGPSEHAFYLKQLGLFYFRTLRLQEAEYFLTDASALIGKSEYGTNSILYANYILEVARLKAARDKNKEAEQLFLYAVGITGRDKENNLWDYTDAAKALSDFYVKMGRYKDAEKLLKEICQLVEQRQGKSFNYASASMDLVGMYYGSGQKDKALPEINALLDYVEDNLAPTHWMVLDLYNLRGLIALDNKQLDAAEKDFRHCIAMRDQTGYEKGFIDAVHWNNLSLVLMNKGDFKGAEKLLNDAVALRKRRGIVLNVKNYVLVTDNFATLYQASGRMEEAEKVWRDIITKLLQYTRDNFFFMSDEEKAQFWNDIKFDFEYFNTFAVLRAKENPAILGEMYNNQLATKAILLSASNKIRNRILGSGEQSMISQYYNWVDTREKLAQFYTFSEAEIKVRKVEMDSLQVAVTTLEKELNISAEDLQGDRNKAKITWKDVQKSLAPNEAAIEIIRFRYFDRYLRDSVLYAALILTSETKTAPRLVVLPDGKFLEGKALRFYKNSIQARLEDKASYKYYWGAIEPFVRSKSKIYLSVDGVFNLINLNTLLSPDNKFLVEEKNLILVPNTREVLAIKSKKAKFGATLSASLFGYPKYFLQKDQVMKMTSGTRSADATALHDADATGIYELPGTESEVHGIKSLLTERKWNATEYTGEAASEDALKSIAHPQVLHIATHGFFVDENQTSSAFRLGTSTEYAKQNPLLRSGLLLSGASNFILDNVRVGNENGILTAYEAANLNLDNTELVVLSACETGKGEVQNGEGVYGLQRAFQAAGAQSVLMSLWKVDDSATQELMTMFYASWMSGKEKSVAFTEAQLQLRKKYNDPYYWGAFVMVGN